MVRSLRTLLLRLPNEVYSYSGILHPYSLAVISGFLKKHKKDVALFDAAIYRLSNHKVLDYVSGFKPDIIGVTIMTQHLPQTANFLKEIKKVLPGITIVAGGPHVTADYKNLLTNNPEIDIAVIGEGEYTLLEIINALEDGQSLGGINGVSYREDGQVLTSPSRGFIDDLDSLPFADLSSLPMDRYFDTMTVRKNYGSIVASRGCPFGCTFCGAKTVLGRQVRRRSPQNIIDEIELLHRDYNVRQVLFHDSTLNIDNIWVNEICEGILRMKWPLLWGCNLRSENLDRATLKLMKRSGCIRSFVGVESGDNNVLKRMKKGATAERITEGIRLIEEAGIISDYGFILGMPGETEESIKRSIALAKKLKGISAFSLASPFPGTELYEIAKQEGYRVTDWARHSMYTLAYTPKGLTRKQLERYYQVAVRSTYLRPSFLIRRVLQLKSFLNLKIALLSMYRIFCNRIFKFKK